LPRATYSFSTSFWTVPRNLSGATPCSSPTSSYSSSRIAAGALIVIEVDTSSSGISLKQIRMSSIVSMATPVRPTSPLHSGSSESRPSWVGRSNAIDRPVEPCSIRYR
jgi:hypothetical protein